MAYCAIDLGKREYSFNVSLVTDRDSAKILGSFNYLARKFPNLVWDRFGILDKVSGADFLPSYTKFGLIDAALMRVHELGPRYIAWSGGIDSSFIVACYIHEKVPFSILYNNMSTADAWSEHFLKYFKLKGIECLYMSKLSDYAAVDGVITGDGADILFAPENCDLFINSPKTLSGRNLGIEEALSFIYSDDGERLFSLIVSYGRKLNRSIKTDIDISRLVQWGCFYYFKRDYFRVITGADARNMTPFFNTRTFSNISYSQYWDARYDNGHKKLQRKFISKVFGVKELYNQMQRNRSVYLRPFNAADFHEIK